MVIDFEAVCRNLDIDHKTLKRAGHHLHELLWNRPKGTSGLISTYLSLPPDELLALIRVEKLYERYPDYFTYDGPTGKHPE